MTIHGSSKWLLAVCFGAKSTVVIRLSFCFEVSYFLREIFKKGIEPPIICAAKLKQTVVFQCHVFVLLLQETRHLGNE